MDRMTSTDFRKRYASLTQPVEVTVSGHPIGTWTPHDFSGGYAIPNGLVERTNAAIEQAVSARFAPVPETVRVSFTPAPKPSQHRK